MKTTGKPYEELREQVFKRLFAQGTLDAQGPRKVHFALQGTFNRMFVRVATGAQVEANRILNSLVPKDSTGPVLVRHDFAESVVMPTPGSPLAPLPVLAFEATVRVSDMHPRGTHLGGPPHRIQLQGRAHRNGALPSRGRRPAPRPRHGQSDMNRRAMKATQTL